MPNPFRYFNSSPEVIRLTVMMYIRYPLSLRQVEDLLFERGIDICHETVRFWWNRWLLSIQSAAEILGFLNNGGCGPRIRSCGGPMRRFPDPPDSSLFCGFNSLLR